jgi:hypothetical protein
MDFFNEAFGGFQPHSDKDAAIKFALNSLLMDAKLVRLVDLIDSSTNVGCIEGEPGWELEHLEDSDRSLSGYLAWPHWAHYRAAVDPECYQLTYPEIFLDRGQFVFYVEKAVAAFLARFPQEKGTLNKLVALIEKSKNKGHPHI